MNRADFDTFEMEYSNADFTEKLIIKQKYLGILSAQNIEDRKNTINTLLGVVSEMKRNVGNI